MNKIKIFLPLAVLAFAVVLAGCEDKKDQPAPLTKEEVTEAVIEALEPTPWDPDALEPGEQYPGQNEAKAQYEETFKRWAKEREEEKKRQAEFEAKQTENNDI